MKNRVEKTISYSDLAKALDKGLEPLKLSYSINTDFLSIAQLPLLNLKIRVKVGVSILRQILSSYVVTGYNILPELKMELLSPDCQIVINREKDIVVVILHDLKKVRSLEPQFIAVYKDDEWTVYIKEITYILLKFLRWFIIAASLGRNSFMNLHGSMVRYNDNSLLIMGTRGQGKSTITLGLIEQGFLLLSEDAVFFDASGYYTNIYPSGESVIRSDWTTISQFPTAAGLINRNFDICVPVTDQELSKLEIPYSILNGIARYSSLEYYTIDKIILLVDKDVELSIEEFVYKYSNELWSSAIRLLEYVIKYPHIFIDKRNISKEINKEWGNRSDYWLNLFNNLEIITLQKRNSPILRILELYHKLNFKINDGCANSYLGIIRQGLSPHIRSINAYSSSISIKDNNRYRRIIKNRINNYCLFR